MMDSLSSGELQPLSFLRPGARSKKPWSLQQKQITFQFKKKYGMFGESQR